MASSGCGCTRYLRWGSVLPLPLCCAEQKPVWARARDGRLWDGPDVLDGPFAGVELALNRFVTLLGEYDAHAVNAGVRLFPLPEKWEAYGIPRPTVDVLWQEGGHISWGISFRSVLGEAKFQAQRVARADKRYHRRSAALFADTSCRWSASSYRQNSSSVGWKMCASPSYDWRRASRSWWSTRIDATTGTSWMRWG